MKVRAERDGSVLRLRLEGADALDTSCAPQVREDLIGRLSGGADAVLDLSGVEFVDSAGVGVLVSVYKVARLGGRRVLFAGARPPVLAVLELIRLDRIFGLYPDTAAAIRALEADCEEAPA